MLNSNVASHVNAAYVVGSGAEKKLYVVAAEPSVKLFKAAVVESSGVRQTKRFDTERVIKNSLIFVARKMTSLKGKHISRVEVIASTGKSGLFRDASGHFVKLEGAENVLQAAV